MGDKLGRSGHIEHPCRLVTCTRCPQKGPASELAAACRFRPVFPAAGDWSKFALVLCSVVGNITAGDTMLASAPGETSRPVGRLCVLTAATNVLCTRGNINSSLLNHSPQSLPSPSFFSARKPSSFSHLASVYSVLSYKPSSEMPGRLPPVRCARASVCSPAATTPSAQPRSSSSWHPGPPPRRTPSQPRRRPTERPAPPTRSPAGNKTRSAGRGTAGAERPAQTRATSRRVSRSYILPPAKKPRNRAYRTRAATASSRSEAVDGF